jgi:uncharacterized protein
MNSIESLLFSFHKYRLKLTSMNTKIFVNLPVKDLNKSIDFFSRLGYTFNPQFTDENATCMIISEDIYVMLLIEKFFKTFTHKEISDSSKSTEVIISLSADSKQKVDEMFETAIKEGASKSGEPQDHGWMYQRGFQDLDGHLWEIIFMDMNAFQQN